MNYFRLGQFVSIPRTNGTVTKAQISLIAADHVEVSWVEADGKQMGKDFSIPEFLALMKKSRKFYYATFIFFGLMFLAIFATGVRSNYLQSIEVSYLNLKILFNFIKINIIIRSSRNVSNLLLFKRRKDHTLLLQCAR